MPAEACLSVSHFSGALGFRVDPEGSLESAVHPIPPSDPLPNYRCLPALGDIGALSMGSEEGKVEGVRSAFLGVLACSRSAEPGSFPRHGPD